MMGVSRCERCEKELEPFPEVFNRFQYFPRIGPGANSSNSDRKAKRGRTLELMTYEQLLSEDLQTAKRKLNVSDELGDQPTIIPGILRIKTIRVSSLPPSLQRRFKHPGRE